MYAPRLAAGRAVVDSIEAPAENFSPGIPDRLREELVEEAAEKLTRRAGAAAEADPLVDPQQVTLQRGRVTVTVDWRSQYTGASGRAFAIAEEDRFAYFYFTDPGNPEVFVKVLDFSGGGSTPPFLVFYAGISDFEYTVTFHLVCGGTTRTFRNDAGRLTAGADNTTLQYCSPLAPPIMPSTAGVSSLNGLTGTVGLLAGSNVQISPSGNSLVISATGGSGVSSVNGATGAVNVTGSGAASVSRSGSNVNVNVPAPIAVAALYYQNDGQNLSSPETRIDYGNRAYDTHSAVRTGGAWAFVTPVGGLYHVSASIQHATHNGHIAHIIIRVNGATAFASRRQGPQNLYSEQTSSVNGVVQLQLGDEVSIHFAHNDSETTRFVTDRDFSYVSIARVGG